VLDVLAIRWVAPCQGTHVADWIKTQIDAGRINSSKPIHLIGHSAGGFVAGDCGLDLKDIAGTQQLTMLDTPCPYKRHVKKYQQLGKVERYISSALGLATLDFQTKGTR